MSALLGRVTMLSKFEETGFYSRGKSYELSANQYPLNAAYPQGFQYLKSSSIYSFGLF